MIDKRLNKLKILPLALLSPLLLANSPAPRAEPDPYENYSYTDFALNNEDDNYKYYSTTITNSGTGYISLDSLYLKSKTSNKSNLYFSNFVDYNELIPPEGTYNLTFNADKNINVSNYELKLEAYVEYIDNVVTNIQIENINKTSSSTYDVNDIETKTFCYSIELSFDTNETYSLNHYSSIYEISIDGELHYYFSYSVGTYFSFYTEKDVTKQQITINNILALEEDNHSINIDGSKILEGIGIVVLAIALGVPLTGGLVVAIIFLIKGIKNKRKYKQDNK